MPNFPKAAGCAALAAILSLAAPAVGQAAVVGFIGVVPEEALGGFDAVALSQGRRIAGQGRFTYVFGGLQWRFASDANRQTFKSNPSAYRQNQQ
jgi:YHS domain-containing protein